MARTTKTYYVYPKNAAPGVAEWAQIGAGANAGVELRNTGSQAVHPTGSTPESGQGVSSSSSTAKEEGLFEPSEMTLGTDEVITSVKFYLSRELGTETASVFSFGLVGGESTNTSASKAKQWQEGVTPFTTNSIVHKVGNAKLREALKWVLKKLKVTAAKAFEVCMVLETRTESALICDRLWGPDQATTSVNGEGKFTTATTTNNTAQGQPLVLLVSTNSGQGASAVKDSAGNVWVKDAEAHFGGTEGTLQVWRTTATTEEKITITAEGLKTGDKMTLHGTEWLGAIAGVYATASASGTGTAVTAGAVTTRPGQGDCVLLALWQRRKENGKAFTATLPFFAQVASSANSGAASEPEYVVAPFCCKSDEPPAENTTFTPAGTFPESQSWLAITVDYEVKAATNDPIVMLP